MVFKDFRTRWLLSIAVLSLLLSIHTAVVKAPPPYEVVSRAAANIFGGENPYTPQPGLDFFKYSPLFGVLVAPLNALPAGVGMTLFLLVQIALFVWSFDRFARVAGLDLRSSPALRWVAFFSVVTDLTVSIQNAQVNVGIFALMLLGAAMYAEGALVRAGLVLALATNLKLFPFTLGLCLLTGLNRRYWLSFVGGLGLWFFLPALFLGLERDMELHRDWLSLMRWDQTRELEMLDLGSFLSLHFGVPSTVGNVLAVLSGLAIGIACFHLFRIGDLDRLHRYVTPINGLYVLLFSYLSESPTSILAVAGIFLIGAAAVRQKGRAPYYWAAWGLALALIPLFYSDLVPRHWGLAARAFHLKTLGYAFVATVNLYLFHRERPKPRSGSDVSSH